MSGRKVGDAPDSRPIVLYVEDNLLNQKVLYHAIHRQFAVDVVIAETAGEGVVAALSLAPAVVFLDLNLPDADGATVLSALRADSRTSALPIYVITADATEQRRLDLLGAGASGYITKPVDLALLYETLDSLHLPRT